MHDTSISATDLDFPTILSGPSVDDLYSLPTYLRIDTSISATDLDFPTILSGSSVDDLYSLPTYLRIAHLMTPLILLNTNPC